MNHVPTWVGLWMALMSTPLVARADGIVYPSCAAGSVPVIRDHQVACEPVACSPDTDCTALAMGGGRPGAAAGHCEALALCLKDETLYDTHTAGRPARGTRTVARAACGAAGCGTGRCERARFCAEGPRTPATPRGPAGSSVIATRVSFGAAAVVIVSLALFAMRRRR